MTEQVDLDKETVRIFSSLHFLSLYLALLPFCLGHLGILTSPVSLARHISLYRHCAVPRSREKGVAVPFSDSLLIHFSKYLDLASR